MVSFREKINKMISSILNIDNEERNLLKYILFLNLSKGQKILDIGCGYGKKMTILSSKGYEVLGIDVNSHIIKENIESGLNCMTLKEFERTNCMYDVLLMSHVIEHFLPMDLWKFMDSYLDRLHPGGYLIIATPLSSRYFYDDFDHVKPYHPMGIQMVFESGQSQIQYTARNHLDLMDIWFRKNPYRLNFYPGFYVNKYSKIPIIINLFYALLYRASFSIIGKKDGWMGLYRKKNKEMENL
jgi:SAM-dependent methyltransferase